MVSAYVDKVLGEDYFVSKYKASEAPNFSTFINHVLKEYKESDCYQSYSLPCFAIDVHWRPYNARCMYCDIPYNVIGRVESFDEDVKYILLRQNLTHLLSLNASQLHTHETARYVFRKKS